LFPVTGLEPDWIFEDNLSQMGYKFIGGVDDAGRGPIAGPVFAACVIFHKKINFPGLRDSKTISHKKREALFKKITLSEFVSFSVGISTVEEIDRLNILRATQLAMKRAVEKLEIQPDALLIDGNIPVDGVNCFQKTVVKGDAKCMSISAASIIAKVARDRWMNDCASIYPQYNFDIHKGYGTREHFDLLEKFGPCRIHRKTFAPVKKFFKKGGVLNFEKR